ncbi:hypothetical protein NMG60_11000629 [Bertholletia excelsa]
MNMNGSNSPSHEFRSSRGLQNEKDDKKLTVKDIQHPVFVNHAEIAWHESRRAWIGDQSQKSGRIPREPIMSLTTTYEDLLLSTDPFHQPIPLAEMVDFLVDVWHEEGLYD